MQLQKEINKEKNAKISVQVTVDKSTINETREEIINGIAKNAKIPGFRKGRVPRNILLSRFSDSIKNETISTLLTRSLEQIMKEDKFKPISDPAITEMGDLTPEEDFTYRAEFDVVPEIKLAEYKGITSERYVYKVNDKSVERELAGLRERFSTLVSIDENAKVGDYVVVDYEEYTSGDKKINMKKDQTILLDDKSDQFVKQIVGMAKGDERDIILENKVAEDEKKQSPEVKLHVMIKDVKKKELPELNDDFAKDISDVETIKELRQNIKEEIQGEAKQRSAEKTKEELVKKLIEKSELELPESMINREINRMMTDIVSAYKLDLKKLQEDDKKYEEYRSNMRPRAMNNLKYELLLGEIVKKENIEVEEKEIDEEINKYAEASKKNFQSVKQKMVENNSIENLKYRLKMNRALDLIYENANLTKVKNLNYDEEGGDA
jgi:trigger factor